MPPVTVTSPPAPETHPNTVPSPLAPVMVDPGWIAERLGSLRLIDTRRTRDFLAGHLPGACSFPLEALLVDDTSTQALERMALAARVSLASRGISPTTPVVLVDDLDGSASLGALVCELAGVQHVSVALGGTGGWRGAGHAVELKPASGHARLEPSVWEGVPIDLRRLASFEQLVDAVETGSATVLDVRAQLEHEGIVGPPCCTSRGSIPGAVNLEWTALLSMSGGPQHTERVQAIAEHLGLALAHRVIVTCHAGHRAAAAARVLRASGFADVRVSLGSWHEWSQRFPVGPLEADTGQPTA